MQTTEIPPYQRHSETSRLAALSKVADAKGEQARVYRWLRSMGEAGATDQEIQRALGIPESTERPRRVELVRLGLVVQRDGLTRATRSGRSAAVWIACRCDEARQLCPAHSGEGE